MKGLSAAATAACLLALGAACASPGEPAPGGVRVVATGLDDPYEILWGPDGFLWVTEKSGGRVTRVDPANGRKAVALTVDDARHTTGGQDGLLGMALHPDLLGGKGRDWVYLAHTYDAGDGRRTKIVRYTYDPSRQVLTGPSDVITGLVSSVDHQSGKLRFGPDGRLYYTIGDQGNNQFGRYCEPIEAQTLPTAAQVRAGDWSAYQGKVLRLDLDGSVPGDNPEFGGVRSHVYATGFRNAQGLAFTPSGLLYGTDQGPKTDDEVNLVRAGGNYGWPHVAGHRDGKAYVHARWAEAVNGCAAETFDDYEIPPDVPTTEETDWDDPAFTPPLVTFDTVDDDFDFRADTRCDPSAAFVCWPTLALSSLEPGPGGTLLATSLKDGAVYRIPLTSGGRKAGAATRIADTVNRYRDTAVDPAGKTLYIATDGAGFTRDAAGTPTRALENPGAILSYGL
ncbi:quinoprotein glucose dehydrogenase [Herbidospora sp. NEAU-GS84]|uniref:Quinoprotein glucose dehydrogenase n=1 Tax=Herbidospora solisilvae TaxID=2696284 RepID=A0A7C9MZK3_9ACTN|nr:glucose/sorbosone family PQQ-dependent dehydrogenase [Herbidospora solisilvae]NAS21349.1 quinoprotein glucose dehydrogenase [Herbidospora solisilvae]